MTVSFTLLHYLQESLLKHIIFTELVILQLRDKSIEVEIVEISKVVFPVAVSTGLALELLKVGLEVRDDGDILTENLVQLLLDVLDVRLIVVSD
ncbi:hypothetical protein HG530_000630 [Fusarium avenaceum]|nr:hypothetical protein HG530_000630 [Fusarium avenaceum]